MAHPSWYLYLDGFGPPMLPSGGATGSIQWIDPSVANHGFARNASAVSDTMFGYFGTRPERWSTATDAWVHGFFKYGWADEHLPIAAIDTAQSTITLGHTPVYGIAEGTPFYAYNLLEEVTQPGEWYLDRARHRLYLDPPPDIATSEIVASMIDAPLLRASNAHDGGLPIAAVYLDDCLSGIRVEGNIFRDVDGIAVLHGGGRDDVMLGNVFARASAGLRSDARCTTWARPTSTPGDSHNLLEKLEHVNYQSPPWSIRYPECAAIPDDYTVILDSSMTWLFPEGSRFASNVGFDVASWMADSEGAFMHIARMDNFETTASPFASEMTGDLTQTSAVLAVPGFMTIPVDQIGIRP